MLLNSFYFKIGRFYNKAIKYGFSANLLITTYKFVRKQCPFIVLLLNFVIESKYSKIKIHQSPQIDRNLRCYSNYN